MATSGVGDAFVGRRVAIERRLVCTGAGQFPVLARGGAGELAIVVRSGGEHYGLAGTLATAYSDDGGRTWSDRIEVAPGGNDVRNPAFGIAPDGRWLLAYWKAGVHCYDAGAWRLPDPSTLGSAQDLFVVTSADRGRTWTGGPQRSELLAWASPFGRIIAAPGGELVMAAYGPRRDAAATAFDAIAMRSHDGGATWGDESLVLAGASELALCTAAPDRLVGAARRASGDTAIVHSRDGGRTWSTPTAATRTLEHPGDLCVLAGSGRLMLTFGRRRRPLGCGALTSTDAGESWDAAHEVLLAGDGIGNDVGYPSTVQLDDGSLVTALYFAHGSASDWGELTCQVLRYPESAIVP